MRTDTQTFLLASQRRVIEGYLQVLRTWPDLPEEERAGLAMRLRRAKEELLAYEAAASGPGMRAAA